MKNVYHSTYFSQTDKHGGFDWRLTKRLLGYLRPYQLLIALAVLLLVVSKAIEAIVPLAIGEIVRRALSGASFEISDLAFHCLLVAALIGLSYIIDSGNVILRNWVGQHALYTLRMDVYSHIESMPLSFFNNTPVGALMTRAIHDVDQINQMYSESVVPLLGSLLLFAGICVGLIVLDIRVALVLFVLMPPLLWLANDFRKNQRRCYDIIRGIVSAMNAFVQEHLLGASTIRSFGLLEEERKRFDRISRDHRDANVEAIHYFAFFFAGIEFLQSVSLVLVFLVLSLTMDTSHGFDAGVFFTFSLYILMIFRPLADLTERYNILQSAMAAAVRIFHVLDETTEKVKDTGGEELSSFERLEFDDVWFAYKENNFVLKGLSFALEKGQTLALVGMTGEGKTTILQLLLRFYDIQQGRITINGRDIRHYSLKSLRGNFSTVLQDPEIFSGTIASNITLGKPQFSKEEVEDVVRYVHLSSFVDRFPDGVEHCLSERGKSLSAGERQLIALARAVLFDRDVLILDEATANIDSRTEELIQAALKKMLRTKTCMIIAHRLSTIRNVDVIAVIHRGKIVEMGAHEELLRNKGMYEKLYRLQFISH